MNGEEDDDEFYLENLIGFAVVAEEAGASSGRAATAAGETGSCASGKLCGTVTDYYDSDANPLFELEIGGRQVLVPPSRSSSPASTSRGARCTWCCPKDS